MGFELVELAECSAGSELENSTAAGSAFGVRIADGGRLKVSSLLAGTVNVAVAALKQRIRIRQICSQGRERSSGGDSKCGRIGDAPVRCAVEIAVRAQDQAVRVHAVRAIRERAWVGGAEVIDRGERRADFEWRYAEGAAVRRCHGYGICAGSRGYLRVNLSIRHHCERG